MARPRKPTTLKLVAGTDRVDRATPNEPAPETRDALPPAPEHLAPDAAEAWSRLGGILHRMGVLTTADEPALERLCVTYADLRRLDMTLEMLGSTTYEGKSAKDGYMRRGHPEYAQRADAERRFLQYLGQFGLTPAARTKVSAGDGSKAGDALQKYFG